LLPEKPGVYWYQNAGGNTLYVGKAKNLKARLVSYKLTDLPRTRKMLSESVQVHYQVLDSELDALIIEAELIKRHQPPYNIRLKDDKSALYIVITKETFPRLYAWRKNVLISPPKAIKASFGPYPSSKDVKLLLRYARRLFPYCSASDTDRKRHRACLWHHLHLCPGVCAGTVSASSYQTTIKHITLFLQGKKAALIRNIKRSLAQAVKELDFELAQQYKQVLTVLLRPQQTKAWEKNLPHLESDTAGQALIELISLIRPYLRLPPSYRLDRIETYDISHLQGDDTTAAMVVMEKGRMEPTEYRHFNIRQQGINDPGMLVEVLGRRFKHPEWPLPNLIVVDGGRSQVRYVYQKLKPSIPVMGIAKHPDRFVFYHPATNQTQSLTLPPDHDGARLIQQARDEAHRFGIKYHTLLHRRHYDAKR
jgi:excinuclease ABC subunit C